MFRSVDLHQSKLNLYNAQLYLSNGDDVMMI